MCRWNRRRIALKLAYLGWDYHGLAIQDPHQPTIEVDRDPADHLYTILGDLLFFHRAVCLSVFRKLSWSLIVAAATTPDVAALIRESVLSDK